MTGLNQISDTKLHARAAWQAKQLTHRSTMRENMLEHLLLAQLGAELIARGVDYDELHSRVDRNGFDVLLEAGGIARHMQVKVKILGGKRTDVSINLHLARKPSGCAVWLTYDPATRTFCDIRWFGAAPGDPLPEIGGKVARHTRANSHGIKAERADHRVLPARRFERLDDIAHLADRLFGMQPAEPRAFLRSRLGLDVPAEPTWLKKVANGGFTAIPCDMDWSDATILAGMIDGYRLLEMLGGGDPSDFRDRQREIQRDTGTWPGGAAHLWTTLFFETRADRFGSNDFAGETPHLNLLCRQLREALIALETANA